MDSKMGAPMNIFEATRHYEDWMERYVTLVSHKLLEKHAMMMRDDPFIFLRGTHYRWLHL
jgi:hypothetical protein